MKQTFRTTYPHHEIILIVDDNQDNLMVLAELLWPHYQLRVANSALQALEEAATEPHPDLILLDMMTPGIDGYATLVQFREDLNTCTIPVILITTQDDEERGLELGAVDYFTKPIRPRIVLSRIYTHLALKHASEQLKDQNNFLDAELARRMAENQIIQDVSIQALAHLAESWAPETDNHLLRTQAYVQTLARQLQKHPRFFTTLSDNAVILLTKAAPLHDIGKLAIPDHILLKQEKLTMEEWEIIKTHAQWGADALESAERSAEKPIEFLIVAKEIAHWHHEKWDGSGYPDGLVGDAIPVSARLMALADVFDALISQRVYKPALPLDQARDIIVERRGTHFDPEVVDAFLATFDEFVVITKRYQEELDVE
ncbi:putative cyclic di-GMP phosphodiesterase VC_1348 [Gammaproteobacteria bacterium]